MNKFRSSALDSLKTISVDDPGYPELLRAIHVPPRTLYYLGQPPVAPQAIAIVGARAANAYGKAVVQRLVPQLVEYGFTIVSGGALGIDQYAHQAALNHKGRTIAVLGSGLSHWYPHQNKKLFADIIEQGGTLVSPFEPDVPPRPFNFPARNRIISGLSRGCVVVQAAQKSGALITARCALDQGREVFAVPGPIDSSLSEGCHRLIQEGAKLVSGVKDILIEYGIEVIQPSAPSPAPHALASLCQQPRSFDELLSLTNGTVDELQSQLLQQMLSGVIEQNAAGLYVST